MNDQFDRPVAPDPCGVGTLFTLQVCYRCGCAWEWPVDLLPLEVCFDCRVEGPWAVGEASLMHTLRSAHAVKWILVMRWHTVKMGELLEAAQ